MPDWKAVVLARFDSSSRPPAEVVDEIAQHAEALFQRSRSEGASDEQATAIVEQELADLSELERTVRTRRAGARPLPEPTRPGVMGIVAAFVKDLAYGCRLLTARPAFTAVAVLTLALGIGANTAIFSVVHALLLAPLPFADPERLVMLWESEDGNAGTSFIVSAPNWQDWRRQVPR